MAILDFEDQDLLGGVVFEATRHVCSQGRMRAQGAEDGGFPRQRVTGIAPGRLLQEIGGAITVQNPEITIPPGEILDGRIARGDAFGAQEPAIKEIREEISLEQHR